MTQSWRRLLPLAGAALFAAYTAAIFVHRWPPFLGDFPDWVYQGSLLARHMRGLPDAGHALKMYPVPNSTVTVVLGLLMLVMPWAVAAKLTLCGWFAVASLGVWRLARACGTGRWIWLVAPGAFVLNVNLWFGLVAFQLGMAVLFLFVAEVLERCRPAVLSVLLVLLFLTHMVPFAFGLLLLGCVAAWSRRGRLVWAGVPGCALLAWYAAGRFAGGNPDGAGAGAAGGSAEFALYKVNTVLKSLGFVNPGTAGHGSVALAVLGHGGFAAVFAVNAVVCAAVVWLVAAGAFRWWRTRQSAAPGVSAVWTAVLVCVPVYLLLPRDALGVSDPGSRVLQIALYLGVFLAGTRPRLAVVAGAGSVVLAVVGLALFVRVGFAVPAETGAVALPRERLALAPYAIREYFYRDLDRGGHDATVFPTGLFVGRRGR